MEFFAININIIDIRIIKIQNLINESITNFFTLEKKKNTFIEGKNHKKLKPLCRVLTETLHPYP